jgi:hypothetical protein
MQSTIIRSPGAIALGLLFSAGTTYVLLEDVFHGAPFTTSHMLTALAIVGTIAAGHMAWPHILRGNVLAALGLSVLFAAGTLYVVVAAGARNADVQIQRSAKVAQSNADRLTAERRLQEARKRFLEADDAAATECATGKGLKCEGKRATAIERQSHVFLLQAELQTMAATVPANAGYHHAAQIASLFGADAAGVERALVLLMPFLLVLICEFGTLVFWSVGLGHDPNGGTEVKPGSDELEPIETDDVIDFVRQFRARNGRDPQIPEVQAFYDLPKTTAWRRIKAA